MKLKLVSLLALVILSQNWRYCNAAEQIPPLTWKTYEDIRAKILPTAQELSWSTIPWRHDLGAAVQEASRKQKPLLIWAMNGDPMGCT